MTKDQWVWMPHAAHFILGDKCRFHLATYVGGYIVSTVGELFNCQEVHRIDAKHRDSSWFAEHGQLRGDAFQSAYFKRFGWEQVGAGRTYETLVFPAVAANSDSCCPFVVSDYMEIDFGAYNDAIAARDGHMALCEKWANHDSHAMTAPDVGAGEGA